MRGGSRVTHRLSRAGLTPTPIMYLVSRDRPRLVQRRRKRLTPHRRRSPTSPPQPLFVRVLLRRTRPPLARPGRGAQPDDGAVSEAAFRRTVRKREVGPGTHLAPARCSSRQTGDERCGDLERPIPASTALAPGSTRRFPILRPTPRSRELHSPSNDNGDQCSAANPR